MPFELPPTERMIPEVNVRFVVKNISDVDFNLVELNKILVPGEEINLLDPDIPCHYGDEPSVLRACELAATSIYRGLHNDPPTISLTISPLL